MKKEIRRSLVSIYLLTFVNVIGFSILIPVLPFIVEDFGGGAFSYGLLLSTYSFSLFLASPLIGSISDKYGRRPALIVSQAGTFFSWLIFAFALLIPSSFSSLNLPFNLSLPLLIIFISRLIDGITGGNMSVANAYLADVTSKNERTKIFGINGAIVGIGFIFGPALGGYSSGIESLGYFGTILLAGSISFVTLLAIILNLKESLKKENLAHDLKLNYLSEINVFAKIKAYSKSKKLKYIFTKGFFMSMAMGFFVSTFALYAKDYLNLNAEEIGLLMLFIGFFKIFNQSILVPKIAKKFGDFFTLNLGHLIFACSVFFLGFNANLTAFILIMYFADVGISLTITTQMSLLTKSVDDKNQGRVAGLNESIRSGTNGVAPLVAGAIYAFSPSVNFMLMSIIVLIPFLIFSNSKYSKIFKNV